jgi:hypothetical protein
MMTNKTEYAMITFPEIPCYLSIEAAKHQMQFHFVQDGCNYETGTEYSHLCMVKVIHSIMRNQHPILGMVL